MAKVRLLTQPGHEQSLFIYLTILIYLILLRIVYLARAQLVAEIDTVLGGKEPAFDNVDDLPFLHAVVNETLRYDSLVIVINDQTTPRLIRSMARTRTRPHAHARAHTDCIRPCQ